MEMRNPMLRTICLFTVPTFLGEAVGLNLERYLLPYDNDENIAILIPISFIFVVGRVVVDLVLYGPQLTWDGIRSVAPAETVKDLFERDTAL